MAVSGSPDQDPPQQSDFQPEARARSLRLGDTILLYAQERNSYVFSDISSNVVQSVAVCPVVPPFKHLDPNLPDTHGACFRVLAANKHDAQLKHKKLKWKLKKKQTLSTEEVEQLNAAEKNLQTEKAKNEEMQKRVRGNTLAYGVEIQLQHVYTGKYLCVNSSHTSSTLESTNLRMELSSENSQNCIFMVLPRYKVGSVGGEVRMNDQVIFESVGESSKGQFLHCSTYLLERTGQHLHRKYHELNVSATGSAFTIVPHFCPKEDAEKDVLTPDSIVRLFHWEMECYLVSGGSFASMEDTEADVKVLLRKRRTDRGRLKAPSTSAITYWRIEKQREPLSGEALHWRELCRIQHLPTRQYLAVVKIQDSYKMTLRERSAGAEFEEDDTTFRLFPVIEGDDDVNFGSYARIYHVHTKLWLHAGKRENSTPKAEGSQWDGGEYFSISASQQKDNHDAFCLMIVSPDLVSKFDFVAGMVPILQAYIAERKQPGRNLEKEHLQATVMVQVLNELADFMSNPCARCKDHQKLLRNLKVLELIISCLELYHGRQDSSVNSHTKEVCRAGYKVIEVFVQGNSRKNELYLSRFLPIFEAQMRMAGLCAVIQNVLVELVRDNLKIVSTFSVTRLNEIIAFVSKGEKDFRFFDYLGVLCVCEGKALVSRQECILSKMVCQHHQTLFIQTIVLQDIGQHGNPKRVFFLDREARPTLLTEIKPYSERWSWLQSQLDLFAKLAKGNNSKAIRTITQDLNLVTFDEALAGARDCELCPSIRLKYVELLIVLFVDVGEDSPFLESMGHSLVVSELQTSTLQEERQNIALSLTGKKSEYAEELWEWLLQVITDNQKLKCSEEKIMENHLLAEILGVLELLMKFGYYCSNSGFRTIVSPLMDILEGAEKPIRSDLSDTCFKASPAERAVFAVEHRIMKIFDLIFSYRVYLRLKTFVSEFQALKDEPYSSGKSTHSRWGPKARAVSINIDEAPVVGLRILLQEDWQKKQQSTGDYTPSQQSTGDCTPSQQSVGKVLATITRSHLRGILEPTAFFEDIGEQFVEKLLDIASYNDDNLVVWSVHLLNRFFSSESEVFEKAKDTQLLVTETSVESLKTINNLVATFRKITQLELNVSLLDQLGQKLEDLRSLCVVDELLREPNSQNQKILFSCGFLTDVLSLIFHHLKESSFVETSYGHETVEKLRQAKVETSQKAYQFLAYFVRGHHVVQELLFEQMDALLGAQYAVQDMALVISEVFTNCQDLCIKLHESQVEQVFSLITKSKPPEQAALLQALKSMTVTRVNDVELQVKRNQDWVKKYFSNSRKFFNPVLGQDKHDRETRFRIVTCEDDPRLLVMLSVVDLLAACSKGRNVLVQSFCQNILPCDELLELLCNDNIVMSRKLPFCLYLVWVYLDADLEDTHSPNTSDLFGEQWLKYMWKSHGVVNTLVSKLPHIQPTKEVLRSSRYSHFGAQKTHGRRSVLEAVGCLDPGVLEYVLNGIVPLCGIYGKQSMPMLSQEETQEALEKLLRALAKVLLKLTAIVQPFLGSPEEAIDLRFALLTLTSSPHVDHYLDVSPDERGKSKQFIKEAADTKSTALMAFADEQKLKSQFNRFVSNYEAVCNGPNTLQHQLGVKNKDIKDKKYSEAPCRLPLGPGFQKLVACFVRKDKSGYQVLKHTAILIRQLDVSFTKLTSLAEAGQSRQDALDIKCFQVLRAIIYNEIVRIDTELKENQPNKYRRFAATFIEAQNAVQEFGGNTAAKVIPMLNHPNDQVGAEVLAFLSVFMHDGNARVQKGCEFLCDTKEGQFLSSIKERLVQAVAISRERRALRAQLLMRESEKGRLLSTMDEEEEQNPLIGSTDEFDGSEMEDADPMIIYNPAYQHSTDKPVERERDSAEALPDHDPTHVQLTLQMLGLMCDGQNHTLQNFLRHQPESISNVNLIHEVAMFAPRYCSSIDESNVKLVVQVLQTLVEVCVGNFYNQNVVFACQIVDFLNQILQASSFPGCDRISTHMLELKASAVELLEVMLEDTHVDTPKLARNVLKSLDIDAVHDTLALFHEMQSAEGIQRERKDDDAQRAMFKTFHVVKHLCDFDFEDVQSKELVPSEPVEGDKEHPRRQKIWEAWNYCSVHSKSVEVLYENLDGAKVLSKVHFRYDPDDELSEDLVERVKWRVSRKSAEDKVQDFVKWMKAVSGIVHHKNTLKRRWYAQVFLYNHHIWHWAYIFLTIVLNILVLVAWKDPADVTPETERQYTSYSLGLNNASNNTGFGLPTIPAVQLWFGNYFLLSLGGLHIIMSLQVVFTYFLVNWPNFYFKPNFFYTIRNKKRNGSYVDIPFFGMKTFYYLMLLSWSVLSLVFWGYFYPLCLVHIIVNNDTLQKVLRSVTKNWRSLCWVGALELVVLYIYGVVSYAAYQNYFDDPMAGSHCRTLFQCVVSVIRLGMLSGGGLITNADIAPFRDESLIFLFPAYIPRTILDVSFFVIVTTVGLGIFFGIIIDTFSQLEKEKYKAEDDAKDFCFICNLPAHEFNRKAAGFAHHVACEHNMWDYIYFSLELDRTDTSDQNAIQLFVYNQIQEGSHRFFPVLKARCFKHDNDETSIRLARMEEKMQMLLNYFAREEKSKHEILTGQKSQKELIDSAM